MNQVFTAGYQGMGANTLPILADALNLMVVDVRLSPTSPCPRWRGAAMRQALGLRYFHLHQWGNLNYRRAKSVIEILNYSEGLEIFREMRVQNWRQGFDYLLLCGCPERAGCHREILARALSLTGEGVIELDWRSEIKRIESGQHA